MNTEKIEALSNQIDAIHDQYTKGSEEYSAILRLNTNLFAMLSPKKDRAAIAAVIKEQITPYKETQPSLFEDMREIINLFSGMVAATQEA